MQKKGVIVILSPREQHGTYTFSSQRKWYAVREKQRAEQAGAVDASRAGSQSDSTGREQGGRTRIVSYRLKAWQAQKLEELGKTFVQFVDGAFEAVRKPLTV
jgi:hypothetical protein